VPLSLEDHNDKKGSTVQMGKVWKMGKLVLCWHYWCQQTQTRVFVIGAFPYTEVLPTDSLH